MVTVEYAPDALYPVGTDVAWREHHSVDQSTSIEVGEVMTTRIDVATGLRRYWLRCASPKCACADGSRQFHLTLEPAITIGPVLAGRVPEGGLF